MCKRGKGYAVAREGLRVHVCSLARCLCTSAHVNGSALSCRHAHACLRMSIVCIFFYLQCVGSRRHPAKSRSSNAMEAKIKTRKTFKKYVGARSSQLRNEGERTVIRWRMGGDRTRTWPRTWTTAGPPYS